MTNGGGKQKTAARGKRGPRATAFSRVDDDYLTVTVTEAVAVPPRPSLMV